jgi:hypothetical protein
MLTSLSKVAIMHHDQWIFRKLYNSLLAIDGENPYDSLLLPWLRSEEGEQERQWLAAFAARSGTPYPEAETEEIWRLYALSRVNDLLIFPFQPDSHPYEDVYQRPRPDFDLTHEQYISFMTLLGLRVVEHAAFHPFFHEIVFVDTATFDDQPIQLTSIQWPCLMLGNMMFSRAGVCVVGGFNHIDKEMAEASTLYSITLICAATAQPATRLNGGAVTHNGARLSVAIMKLPMRIIMGFGRVKAPTQQ